MRARSGSLELIVCGLIWGSIGVIVKKATAEGMTLVWFRLLIGVAIVVAFTAARGRLASLRLGPRRRTLLLAGAALAVHWALFFEALKRLDVATTILIVFLGPVFIALLAPAVLKERLEARSIGALALSVLGTALIAVPRMERLDEAGLAMAVGSAVVFTAVVFAGKRLTEHYEPAAIVTWQYSVAAVLLSPALVAADFGAVVESLPAVVSLGVVHTGLTGLLYFRALTVTKAQHVGILAYLEPASAILYAWALLGETPTPLMLLGGALILAAGGIIVAGRGEPAPVPAAEPFVVPAEGVTR